MTPINVRKNQVSVSVIIVAYNSRDDLQACLESLLIKPGQGIELIVVDNASTDATANYVEQAFPTVKLIRSDVNLGFGGANNLGAATSRGRYLAFLNPDTVVEPGWLGPLTAALENDPTLGMAAPQILLQQDPLLINACGNDIHISGLTLCRGMGRQRGEFDQVEEVSAISGAAFVIRRELFERIGGFDPTFFLYMEDTDLSWRVRLAGARILYVPDAVVYHNYRLRFGKDKIYYQERNRYLMLLKCLRWSTLLILLPALVLAEAITWGFSLLRDTHNWINKLRAYAWILHNWRAIMQERRRVQRSRVASDAALLAGISPLLAFEQADSGPLPGVMHRLFDPLFVSISQSARLWVRW